MPSVVQSQIGANNSAAVTLGANVTAANSVAVLVVGFNNTNTTITSSAPTYSGSSVGASVKLAEAQSGTAVNPNIYAGIWLLSNLSGDGATFTAQWGGSANSSHTAAIEVAGLGTTPVTGPVNSGHAQGTSAITSGSLTALSQAAFVAGVVGSGGPGGQISGAPGAPWTATLSGNDVTGYIASDSAGDTPVFTPTTIGNTNWGAAIAAVYPGGTVSLPVSAVTLAAPLITPAIGPNPLGPAALTLAAPVPSLTFGAASIPLPVAQVTLAAPLAVPLTPGGDDDPPWHIRRRQ